MNREELARPLNQEFGPGKACGIEKIQEKGLKNIWFVDPPPPPEKNPVKLPAGSIRRALDVFHRLPLYDEANDLEKMISHLFARQEAVQSSRMEGTWSTIDHVLTPGGLYDRKEAKSERASVLGYANALEKEMKNGVKRGLSIFSVDLVKRVHQEVMKKDPGFQGKPGELRLPGKPGSVVFIGGVTRRENSIYNPAPPRHVGRCLRAVLDWMKDDLIAEMGDAGMGLALPTRLALGHSHFEAVHPFRDGNGRVGRILLTLQMAATGRLPLYLSGFIEAEKEAYYRALARAQKKLEYGEIVEFFCSAMIASFEESRRTRAEIERLPEDWARRGQFRTNSGAALSLRFILTHPIFTVKGLSKYLGVSIPAANRAAAQLTQSKIVRERTGFGRNRVFAAEEIIALLSRKFGDDPKVALGHAGDLLNRNVRF